MAGINQGEKLKFRYGEHLCPHGLGTPYDCGQLTRTPGNTALDCALKEETGKSCPFDPTIIPIHSIIEQSSSQKASNPPPSA